MSKFSFLNKYSSIVGYLHRFTLCKIGKLHIRIHNILSPDKTPYLHTHPFKYISIILWGGYTEQILINDKLYLKYHRAGSMIIRDANIFHRIESTQKQTKTLFIAWDVTTPWKLKYHADIPLPNDYNIPSVNGIYKRIINGKERYSKFDNGWYIGHDTKIEAEVETRFSIYQVTEYSKAE